MGGLLLNTAFILSEKDRNSELFAGRQKLQFKIIFIFAFVTGARKKGRLFKLHSGFAIILLCNCQEAY